MGAPVRDSTSYYMKLCLMVSESFSRVKSTGIMRALKLWYKIVVQTFLCSAAAILKVSYMNFKNLILLLVLAVTSLSALALNDREQKIADRLAPVGTSCMAGESCSAGGVPVAGPKDPEQVYNTFCMACHMTGAGEAPILGNVEQWASRIAKGSDILYENAINGIGGMPARGVCMDCSDEDVIATVDYILSKSQ